MYMERLEAGKTCGNSIGFAIRDFFTIMPKDYATEIPKYSLPEFVQQNLERAQQMYCVDICTEIEVFESSLTLIPSNEVSLVEEMRGRGKGKSKTLVTPSGDLFFRTKAFKDFSNDFDGMLKRIEAMEIAERSALAAEIPTLNSPFIKDIIIMATETRKKPDEDDDDSKLDMDSVKDCRDDVKRALTKLAKHHEDMGEMHRDLMEKHEDGAKLHRDAKKALDKLSKTLDAKKPDDGDSDEDKKDKRAREIAARYSN
jgi:hypothetical protein